jgi:hypothetical protein
MFSTEVVCPALISETGLPAQVQLDQISNPPICSVSFLAFPDQSFGSVE